ncbi:hypothetical protein EB118_16860 [bacterium]|nr:hypothetical protein [bacterium]
MIRIQITLNEAQLEIFPSDSWSRNTFRELLIFHQLTAAEVPTTMAHPAFRFDNKEDYLKAIKYVNETTYFVA